MALYFITGISGSGKSTVLQELRSRGYEAYDVDEAGPATAKWHNDATGFVYPKSSIKQADRTEEFLSNHSWKVPREEVIELAKQATDKAIFLGGSIANESELQDLFTSIFALAIDNDTLKARLSSRTNNDWGKSTHEFALTLNVNHELAERYKRTGYLVVDASQPTNVVVSEILEHIHDN